MYFRFLSFRTYGSGVEQFDSKAFMSEDMSALTKAVLGEAQALLACGHDKIVVHSTCDADVTKEFHIILYRV